MRVSCETPRSKALVQQVTHGHRLFQGSVLVTLAEALLPFTGIVTAAFLTRSLGTADYGLLTLSATLISWIEAAIASLLARATVKTVGDAEDWRPLGAAVLRLHVYIGLGVMAACLLLAKPCATLLHEPRLAAYLALFSLGLPIFSLAQCHRSILVGRGYYGERALMSAARWISRLGLIIVLVELGLSVNGAILGSIGAVLIELAIGRYYVRPSWSQRVPAPASLWDYAMPIFLAGLVLRFLNLGLFLLKMLGASAAQAGIYGAAQNVAFVMPGVFAISVSPLLLSTMARAMREGDLESARTLGCNSIRIVVAMLPLAFIAAAGSNEIAVLLFGARFASAGRLIAILIFAGLALMLINLLHAVLIACGSPSWTVYLTAPLLPAAIAGHFFAIPRFGPIGAASVTTGVTCLGAFLCMTFVHKRLGIRAPTATLLRSLLLSGIVYAAVRAWPASGLAVVLKIAVAVVFTICGFIALGELQLNELKFFRSLIRGTLPKRSAANHR